MKKICEDQELDLKNLDIENQKLKNQLEEKLFENKNYSLKLARKEDNISELRNQLDEILRQNHKQGVMTYIIKYIKDRLKKLRKSE